MATLERFLYAPEPGALVKAALAHVQFESIHPFLDGNGRIGRLLIALLLHHEDVLHQPLLYLSLYLKQHRSEYYRLLDAVRFEGDWEAWLAFFLEGVQQTATSAVDTAHRLLGLFQTDTRRVQELGRQSANALLVLGLLRERPVATLKFLSVHGNISFTTVARAVEILAEIGIVREITGRERNRVFAYTAYLTILNEGAERL